MADIYTVLETLGISYTKHEHPPLFTVEQADEYHDTIPGAHTKNLFLRNKKGDRHYLVGMLSHKKADIKSLRKKLQEAKLSFASPERLQQYLQLKPGSVSPFGLIHDTEKEIEVVLDIELLDQEIVNFHPNINTATLGISGDDFQKFLRWSEHNVRSMEI